MKKLPIWVVTHKFPAFYDCESATVLEQTAKIYGAMQELIDEYNTFVEGINKSIEEFESGINSDYELFKQSINTQIYDFTHVVELKIEEHTQSTDEQIQSFYSQLEANFNAYKTSLNAIVEQYKNSSQADYEEFTETIRGEFLEFQSDMNNRYTIFKNAVEKDIDEFKEEVNNTVSEIRTQMNNSLTIYSEEINNLKNYVEENLPEGDTVLLDNYNDVVGDTIPDITIEEGAKYLLSVVYDNEGNTGFISNVETTGLTGAIKYPDVDNYTGIWVDTSSFAYGSGTFTIYNVEGGVKCQFFSFDDGGINKGGFIISLTKLGKAEVKEPEVIVNCQSLINEKEIVALSKELLEGEKYHVCYYSSGYGEYDGIITATSENVPSEGTTITLKITMEHPMGDTMYKYIFNDIYGSKKIVFYENDNYDSSAIRKIHVEKV